MKLLFYVSKLYSIPVVQPLVAEAAKRDDKVSLYVSAKVKRWLPEQFSSLGVFTELEDAAAFNPDFVLCPGNFVDFRLPGVKVELFHGIGIEKPSHYEIRHFFDIYLTSGPVVTEKFRMLQKKHRYFRVFETGWPKIDHILQYDGRGLRERLGIPPEKKIILYAPTHSRSMQSADDLLPVVAATKRPYETWFCKPHEFMNKKSKSKLTMAGITVIDGYDITPYLHLADVLVSDTSSVVYEFMALDKPVVTYRTTARKDKGIDIESPEFLRDAVDRSLANPGEFSDARHRHLAEVNPKLDGTVSAGILDLLSAIDPQKPLTKARKPLNLFRKAQILYHSRFRKGYLR